MLSVESRSILKESHNSYISRGPLLDSGTDDSADRRSRPLLSIEILC